MEIHNRDIFPETRLVKLYAEIAPLINNSIVDKEFIVREQSAVIAKHRYHWYGRCSMLLVLASMLLTLSLTLVIPRFPGRSALTVVAIVLGAIGLIMQILLLLSRTKQVWLLNRFAAERLRSIKFQAYCFAMVSASKEELKELVDAFYVAEIARLQAELNAADAALALFSPRQALLRLPTQETSEPRNKAVADAAREAYRDLRIAYQRRFAAGEIELLKSSQSAGSTVADILYLLGVVLTLAALIVTVAFPAAESLGHWIDFLAVAAFIMGLLKAIMENASLGESSRGRYEDYIRAQDECEEETGTNSNNFHNLVRRFERVVLDELAQFCQAAYRISYRL